LKVLKDVSSKNDVVNLSPAIDYLKEMKVNYLDKHHGDILYNCDAFFEVKLKEDFIDSLMLGDLISEKEDDSLLFYKKGTYDGSISLYNSLVDIKQKRCSNRLDQILDPLYPRSAPGKEIINPLLKESVGYYIRSKLFEKEGTISSLIESYRDLERSRRIAKFAFDNYKNCEFPFPDIAKHSAEHYARVVMDRAILASELFSKASLYSNASRFLLREKEVLKKIDVDFITLTERILPKVVDDESYDVSDSEEFLIDEFTGVHDVIDDRIKNLKSTRCDVISKIYFEVGNNKNDLVKGILEAEGKLFLEGSDFLKSYKREGIDSIINCIRDMSPVLNLETQSELPVLDRLKYCLREDVEDFEDAKIYSELYDSIVKNKDYLGLKDDSLFLFNLVKEEEN